MRNCHKLCECWPFEESVAHHLKVGYLQLQVLSTEIFPSPKGHGNGNLTDGGYHCPRDYAVEWSLTGVQRRSR
jgi:hypothetical protein